MLRPLVGLIWKDFKVFGYDRQALVMSLVIPVIIASILGWLDSTASDDTGSRKIVVAVVDEDHSDISKDIVRRLKQSEHVDPTFVAKDIALRDVGSGVTSTAIVIPKDFAIDAAAAFSGGKKPEIPLYKDPAKPTDADIVMGEVMSAGSESASKAVFGSLSNGETPLKVVSHTVSVARNNWEKSAHDYAGFGLQGLLFFAVEAAVALARERRQGIWKRLRAAPMKPGLLLLAKGLSSSVIAFGIILLMFGVGAVLFHIRILGSAAGFISVAISSALVASTFGLLVSTIGRTETQARAISTLLILVMLATGGAWFPMDKMPPSVQQGANLLPVRWAVEGFDACTWRGMSFGQVAHYSSNLLLFAAVFGTLAALRFRFSKGVE